MSPRQACLFALPVFFALTLWTGNAFAWKNVGSGSTAVPCNSYFEASLGYNYSSKTVEFCDGSNWTNLLSGSVSTGIVLGTSVAVTNPSRTGDLTTGLFSPATTTVAIAVAGAEGMRLTGTGLGIGTATPGASLDVYGGIDIKELNAISFPSSDSTLGASVAIGPRALAHQPLLASTAFDNTVIGFQAMGSSGLTTLAIQNTVVGSGALASGTNAGQNVAIGYKAMNYSTLGIGNVAIGLYALLTSTVNNYNTAVGISALQNAASAENTAVGDGALAGLSYPPTSGDKNTSLGAHALNNLSGAAASNLALGPYVATTILMTGSNNILIGTDASTDVAAAANSNTLNIGNAIYGTNLRNSTNTTGVGFIGIGTASPNATLDVYGYSKLKVNASAPATCDATHEGSVAYTGTTTHYLCFCDGTSWKQASAPASACTW